MARSEERRSLPSPAWPRKDIGCLPCSAQRSAAMSWESLRERAGNRLGLILSPSFPQTSTHFQVKLGLTVCSWSLPTPLSYSHRPFVSPCGTHPAAPLLPPIEYPDVFFSVQSASYFTVRTVDQLTHMMLTLLSSSAIPSLSHCTEKGSFVPISFLPVAHLFCASGEMCCFPSSNSSIRRI